MVIPDGEYYLDIYVQYERNSHPEKTRLTDRSGTTERWSTGPGFTKIDSDDVVIAASAKVDAAQGIADDEIISFEVVGDFLRCRGSIES